MWFASPSPDVVQEGLPLLDCAAHHMNLKNTLDMDMHYYIALYIHVHVCSCVGMHA